MASDSAFSSSVLVVAYHFGDEDRSGIPQPITPDMPFPLRETMLRIARELKVITDVSEAVKGAAVRRDLHLRRDHFHVQAEPERMAKLVRDTEALQDLEPPAHLHPGLEFGLMSWVRDRADPTTSIALKIGVTPNGRFAATAIEAFTRDGQSYSPGPPKPSEWRKILDDGRAWEPYAAAIVAKHRASVSRAAGGRRFPINLPDIRRRRRGGSRPS